MTSNALSTFNKELHLENMAVQHVSDTLQFRNASSTARGSHAGDAPPLFKNATSRGRAATCGVNSTGKLNWDNTSCTGRVCHLQMVTMPTGAVTFDFLNSCEEIHGSLG